MPSSPRGAPLGLLIRPYEPAKQGRDGDSDEQESWQWSPAGRPARWRRVTAAAKLAVLVVTLAGGLAGCVVVGAGVLWWWLAHLASAGPHH
jgi:hypothetical protein